jgi:hypothetical protein
MSRSRFQIMEASLHIYCTVYDMKLSSIIESEYSSQKSKKLTATNVLIII